MNSLSMSLRNSCECAEGPFTLVHSRSKGFVDSRVTRVWQMVCNWGIFNLSQVGMMEVSTPC